ncbi:MAG: hypothetical protein KDC07_06930 [Chitinophagaceae bacterium]|nr:hypothetical protein [Chitinophagaceae bacterium]
MKPIIIKYKKEHSIRERILLFLLGQVIPVHAKLYGRRQPWGLRMENLEQYPEDTLGNELGRFLRAEELQPVPKVERHDAFHILMDFSTHIYDEAAMQFFLIGNGKISPFTLGTAIFAGLMLPDQWKNFRLQYKRGQKTRCIANWDFKELLGFEFTDVKKAIFFQPVDNIELMAKLDSFDKK